MFKAHKCKHCGKTEYKHSAFLSQCMRDGRVISEAQTFQADPEKFTVFPNASRPRTATELMANIGR